MPLQHNAQTTVLGTVTSHQYFHQGTVQAVEVQSQAELLTPSTKAQPSTAGKKSCQTLFQGGCMSALGMLGEDMWTHPQVLVPSSHSGFFYSKGLFSQKNRRMNLDHSILVDRLKTCPGLKKGMSPTQRSRRCQIRQEEVYTPISALSMDHGLTILRVKWRSTCLQ